MPTIESPGPSEFLTRVSHELRTPLTSILGFAEVMLKDPKLSAESRHEYAEIILHEGRRLSNIIDDCIEIAFNKEQGGSVEGQGLDVSATIARAFENLQPLIQERSIRWKLVRPDTSFLTSTHPLRFRQLMHNFILNSVRLSAPEGIIEVELLPYTRGYEIEIRTSNVKSDDDVHATLKREFIWHHAPNVELRKPGVGFAFAKHLLELQGGSLTLNNLPAGGMALVLRFSNH